MSDLTVYERAELAYAIEVAARDLGRDVRAYQDANARGRASRSGRLRGGERRARGGVRRQEWRYVGELDYWRTRHPFLAAVEWREVSGRVTGVVIRYDAPHNDLDSECYKMLRRGWKRSQAGISDAMAEVERAMGMHFWGATASADDYRWEWAR